MPKILLVEDDASIIESLSQYLEGEGFYNLNIATTKK
jgi:CheY-like chemotaxis protein